MSVLEFKVARLPYQNIAKEIKERGYDLTFIANKINADRNYLYNCLNGTYNLTEKNRQKINELLQTNY